MPCKIYSLLQLGHHSNHASITNWVKLQMGSAQLLQTQMSGNLSQMVEAPEILLLAILIDSLEPWYPRCATSDTLVRVVFQQSLDFFVRALS